jgi:hypothetical protein
MLHAAACRAARRRFRADFDPRYNARLVMRRRAADF